VYVVKYVKGKVIRKYFSKEIKEILYKWRYLYIKHKVILLLRAMRFLHNYTNMQKDVQL
jgi:hypothetical protein